MAVRDHSREAVGQQRRPPRKARLTDISRQAIQDFAELSGLTPESITGAKPTDDGWSLLVDVAELERVPATSTVMATYRVDVDREGHVVSYERLRRFSRNATDPT